MLYTNLVKKLFSFHFSFATSIMLQPFLNSDARTWTRKALRESVNILKRSK